VFDIILVDELPISDVVCMCFAFDSSSKVHLWYYSFAAEAIG
jgi:hypothetical protein